ncbi:MAG: tetratricopeptide repeat protein, partial [Alphaproteobacteria bacterium]
MQDVMQFDLNTYVKLDEKVLAALVTAETTDVTDPSVAFLRSYIFDGCFGLTDGIDKKTAFQEAVLGMKVKDTLCTAKVAVMLAVGSGTARDIRQADKLSRACIEDLEVLAQQGNPYAKCIAGLLYGFGIGMRDKVKGFNYFLSASEQGEPIAQNNLANCYIDGIGTGIDLKQAKRWAMASAYSNYPYGHFTIAQLLEKEGDLQGAVEHYEKAGEQGYVSAMVHAAEYYAFRESPDLQKAFEWFKKASDHGE